MVQAISQKYDTTENDRNDTILINEVFSGRVDLPVTEDRELHTKALELGVDSYVFTIDKFLEKVTAENPDQLEYKVPSVKREYFGNIDYIGFSMHADQRLISARSSQQLKWR